MTKMKENMKLRRSANIYEEEAFFFFFKKGSDEDEQLSVALRRRQMRTVAHTDAPNLASSTKADLEETSRKKDDLEDHVTEPEGNVWGRKLLEQQKRFSEGVRWREEQMKLQLSVNKETF